MATFAVGERTYTASELVSGVYAVGSYTLTPGQALTLANGEIISAMSSGLVLDGNTTLIVNDPGTSSARSQVSLAATFTAHDETFTAVETAAGVIAIDGSITLSAGGPANSVDGVPVSAASGGVVVAGSSTVALTRNSGPASSTSPGRSSGTPAGPMPTSTGGAVSRRHTQYMAKFVAALLGVAMVVR